MKTETPPPMPQQALIPVTEKAQLATDIRKFIIHCRFIILNSPHTSSRNMRTLANLDLCEAHSKWLKSVEVISLKDIAQMTLILRKNLEGIMPHPSNKSYDTSRQKLTGIFDTCMKLLTPKS